MHKKIAWNAGVRVLGALAVTCVGLTLPQTSSAAITGMPMELKRQSRTGEMGMLDHNGRGLQCQIRQKLMESQNSVQPERSAPARSAGGVRAVRAG